MSRTKGKGGKGRPGKGRPDPRAHKLIASLSRLPGDPIPRTELRYSFSGDDRKIVELFRTVCNLSSRDSKRVLIRLIEEWSLEEAARLNLDVSSIVIE